MYNLLIVDDEPVIVEGLYDFFMQAGHLELEVYTAFSAVDALACMNRTRIDIVLTDIEMPVMNGLDLLREIAAAWPRCKMIVVTGYNHFEYIHSSLRAGAVDYVLKTEGDEPILEAVEKAVKQLSDEIALQELIAKAEKLQAQAHPSLRKEYMMELLHGRTVPTDSTEIADRLRELHVPLDVRQPLLMIMGRVDEWGEYRQSDRSLLLFAVHNIAEEYLAETFCLVHIAYSHERFVWMLQPKAIPAPDSGGERWWNEAIRFMNGYIERIQTACKRHLRLPCSFVFISEPFPWEQISRRYETLSFLFARGLGMEKEVLLSDRHLFNAFRDRRDAERRTRLIPLLEECLDKGRKEQFDGLYEELMGTVGESALSRTGMALEIYYSLVAMFISHINRWGLMEDVSRSFNIHQLFSIDEHATWRETKAAFGGLAEALFARNRQESENLSNEVVNKVNAYIQDHLDQDLSLTQLSEVVYLTPSYLSKLYKQVTGMRLTDYIIEARVRKAKEQLLLTPHKVHRIAKSAGFESAAYFTRCFKKMTGLTPQEFRDRGK